MIPQVEEYVPQSQPIVQVPQAMLITSIDGNVEIQDAPLTNIGTNRIKINITKNVQLNKNPINTNENIDNNLAINSQDKRKPDTNFNVADAAIDAVEDIEYTVKESMQHTVFTRQPPIRSGLETSGLCSIM